MLLNGRNNNNRCLERNLESLGNHWRLKKKTSRPGWSLLGSTVLTNYLLEEATEIQTLLQWFASGNWAWEGQKGRNPRGIGFAGIPFGVRETWDQILPVRPLSCCWIWARYITFLGFYIFLLLWSQSNWLSIQRVRTKVNHSRKALSIVPSMNLSGYLSVCDFKRQVKKNF